MVTSPAGLLPDTSELVNQTPAKSHEAQDFAAAELLQELRARGVRFTLSRAGELRYSPSAKLSPGEHAAVRANLDVIKTLLRDNTPRAPRIVAKTKPRATPPPITRSEYAALGLYVIRGTDIVSHHLGDDVARQILTGLISRERAEEWERKRQKEAFDLFGLRPRDRTRGGW